MSKKSIERKKKIIDKVVEARLLFVDGSFSRGYEPKDYI